MFYKKILILTLICSLIPFSSYAAKKSKKATDDEMGSFEVLAEKKANQAKIKKYKYACDGLVDFKWGESIKSLSKKLKKQIIEKDDESIAIKSTNKDIDGIVVLLFEKKKLNSVTYMLTIDKEKSVDTVKEFVRVSKYLNDTYGSQYCIQAESPRNMKKKAEEYAKKLTSGEAEYTDLWLVNDKKTFISHYIEKNEDYKKGSDESMLSHAIIVMDASGIEVEEIDFDEGLEESTEKEIEKKKKETKIDKKGSDDHTKIKHYKGACIDLVPFKWGDKVDTVKKAVKWPLIEDTGNSLFYKGYYCKHTAEVEYIFENNKLTQVCYAFNIPNDKNEDYINDYEEIGDYIYEKLGNCVYADVPEDFDENRAKYAKQIMKGDTEFSMLYSFGDGATGVRHFMRKMTTDDGSKPDCPIDHFIGVWDNSKKNLHKDLEGEESISEEEVNEYLDKYLDDDDDDDDDDNDDNDDDDDEYSDDEDECSVDEDDNNYKSSANKGGFGKIKSSLDSKNASLPESRNEYHIHKNAPARTVTNKLDPQGSMTEYITYFYGDEIEMKHTVSFLANGNVNVNGNIKANFKTNTPAKSWSNSKQVNGQTIMDFYYYNGKIKATFTITPLNNGTSNVNYYCNVLDQNI